MKISDMHVRRDAVRCGRSYAAPVLADCRSYYSEETLVVAELVG